MKRDELKPTYTMPPRPLTIEDFEDVPERCILQLFYWTVNKGDMFIKFHGIEDGRVMCQLLDDRDPDDVKWCDSIHGYLFPYRGLICKGGGAEPLHGEMPAERHENTL